MNIIGTVVDSKYHVTILLGEGGLGSVYQAEQPELSRSVALKVMHESVVESNESRLRFEREAKVLASLDNPHIVKVYSFGLLPNGNPYIAMELLRGQTLSQLLEKETQLDWKRTVKIGLQACRALVDAHKQGVVHRDLKPQNIMLLEKPEAEFVKVLDFGLSRLASEQSQGATLTGTGAIVGTVHYLSPECCVGEKADERSDIYSLGCVLYQCLVGRTLFESDNSIELLNKHRNALPQRLSSFKHLQTMPKALEDVIFKALQKEPRDRYQSMKEFENGLRMVEQDRGHELNLGYVALGNDPEARINRLAKPLLALGLIVVAAISISSFIMQPKRKVLTKQEELDAAIASLKRQIKKVEESQKFDLSNEIGQNQHFLNRVHTNALRRALSVKLREAGRSQELLQLLREREKTEVHVSGRAQAVAQLADELWETGDPRSQEEAERKYQELIHDIDHDGHLDLESERPLEATRRHAVLRQVLVDIVKLHFAEARKRVESLRPLRSSVVVNALSPASIYAQENDVLFEDALVLSKNARPVTQQDRLDMAFIYFRLTEALLVNDGDAKRCQTVFSWGRELLDSKEAQQGNLKEWKTMNSFAKELGSEIEKKKNEHREPRK